MATYTKRRNKAGELRVTAQVRIDRNGIKHSEAQTFPSMTLARRWGTKRDAELEDLSVLMAQVSDNPTNGDLIKRYITEYKDIMKWQRSKESDLQRLLSEEICDVVAKETTPAHLIDHIRDRRARGAGPATAINDLVWLRVIYKIARPAWGIDIDPQVVEDAFVFCRTQKLISRAKKRERRPTADELKRLDQYFKETDGRHQRTTPMRKVFWFAIFSSRRRDEISRIRWDDNNEKVKTGVVRDAKHPRQKEGNHKRFNYTDEAWAIVESMPKVADEIFPFGSKGVGKLFTETCKELGIKDLKLHDMRHEATSRLFEAGLSIVEVQGYTLHEDWNVLKRYTHLNRGHETWTPDIADIIS